VGGAGLEVQGGREEIQGQFDLWVDFDVRNLDPDWVLKLVESVNQHYVPLDREGTIRHDKMTRVLLQAWSPQLAEATLQPVETANQREAEEEELNFVKIKAGLEPELPREGVNFRLRHAKLMDIIEANPEAMAGMDETSRLILQTRLESLEFGIQQEENREIGAVGVRPALEEMSE
jgi:hypothetical protein